MAGNMDKIQLPTNSTDISTLVRYLKGIKASEPLNNNTAHCERGAQHYGERNVDKGIPQHSLLDSGIRHLSLYIQGDNENHHLVAALWNIAWALEQEIKRHELLDLPERQTGDAGTAD